MTSLLVTATCAGALAMAAAPRASRRAGAAITVLAAVTLVAVPSLLVAGLFVLTGMQWLLDRGIPGTRRRPWPVRALALLLAGCALAASWVSWSG